MLKEAKQKYRGMFETQTSGNKTRSGEIGLNNIRTLVSPTVTQEFYFSQAFIDVEAYL